jgi:hypothetical protein
MIVQPFDFHHKAAVTLTVVALCSLLPRLAHADQKIVCPPEVTSTQVSLSSPKGWVGWYRPDTKIKLVGAGVLLGPIRLNGEMQGETEQRKDGTYVNTFVLTGGDAPSVEKWMACNYGATFFQAIQLSITTKECSVVYRRAKSSSKNKPEYAVAEITCK